MIYRHSAWVFLALFLTALSCRAETEIPLDRVTIKTDAASLQRGAALFVNYCLGCHSMRNVRLAGLSGLGLTDEQIKENLLLNGVSLADTMTISFSPEEAKKAFGVVPPDLGLIARARSTASIKGTDWLYSFLRGFYQDKSRPLGWNNRVFDSVAMPHVLYHLQGTRAFVKKEGSGQTVLRTMVAGQMTPLEYDEAITDLVSFLAYTAEPEKTARQWLGFFALGFLLLLFVLTYAVKLEFWKKID